MASSGDAQADFMVGLAALETGRVAEAVLALERHLAAVPANDRARLDRQHVARVEAGGRAGAPVRVEVPAASAPR